MSSPPSNAVSAFLARKSSRPLLLLGVVLLLLAGYAAFWTIRLQGFKAEIATLTADPAAPFAIEGQGVRYGGFPYRFEAHFDQATATRQRPDYQLTLQADHVVILRQVWTPDLHLAFAENVTLTGALRPSALPPVRATARELEASLRVAGGAVQRLSLVFEGLAVPAGVLSAQALAAERLELHSRETRALTASADVAAAQSDPAPTDPMKRAVVEMIMRGTGLMLGNGSAAALTGTLVVHGAPDVASGAPYLKAWVDDGGVLDIVGLDLTGPAGSTQLKATATLDPQNRPLMAGVITSTRPQTVQAVLGGAAAPQEKPLASAQELRLRVQGGELFLNNVPLRTLSPWLGAGSAGG
jgi:hypothetical protein